MLCQHCSTKQISPTDSKSNFKSYNHKYIKLNNNKIIHVLHLNEKLPDQSPKTIDLTTQNNQNNVQTEQPKRVAEPDGDINRVIPLSSSESVEESKVNENKVDIEVSSRVYSAHHSNETNKNDIEIPETFTKLMNSSNFSQKRLQGLSVLDGRATHGYSIIYRNKIKLNNNINNNSNNNNNAVVNDATNEPSPDTQNSKKSDDALNELPLLFYIHGVGGNTKIWQKQLEFLVKKDMK